jgi:hypothetical protein
METDIYNKQGTPMALKLKSLLMEKTNHITEQAASDYSSLEDILTQQEAAFKALTAELNAVNYIGVSDEARDALRDNAEVLAAAYLEYIENTRATMQSFADQEAYAVVIENAATLAERIENGLTY